MPEDNTEDLGRRELLKRSALVGGALVWTVPAVQTLASPAFAIASPAGGGCRYSFNCRCDNGATSGFFCFTYESSDPAKCAAFVQAYCNSGGNAAAAFLWAFLNDVGGLSLTCDAATTAPTCNS